MLELHFPIYINSPFFKINILHNTQRSNFHFLFRYTMNFLYCYLISNRNLLEFFNLPFY